MKRTLFLITVTLQLVGPLPAVLADLQMSGRPVPELKEFDHRMLEYMAEHDITAGVLGVMNNGKIIYLRGFGSTYDGDSTLPENALFRLASCSKPITAAAVRKLIAAGTFSLNRHALKIKGSDGLLDATDSGDYRPFLGSSSLDARLKDITIEHLISHRGGWDRDITGDLTYRELDIAKDMDIDSPPGRVNTVCWILGKPLQFDPGTASAYSNIGYLLAGLIVEQCSGKDLVSYVRNQVLTAEMWVPSTEIKQGHTFRNSAVYGSQDGREPLYHNSGDVDSVFPDYKDVPYPYGGWDHEARIGQGGFIASAATMLEFLQNYHVDDYDSSGQPVNVGLPINTHHPLVNEEAHNGACLSGLNSYMVQRPSIGGSRINVFIVFNKTGSSNYADDFYDNELDPLLDGFDANGFAWPTATCDGFWIVPDFGGAPGIGGYDHPFRGLDTALEYITDGSKLRLKSGSLAWKGTIKKRLLIDAPLGPAVIGKSF
jgi:CubicO group peptidase (beta-lactamase class C family)